jgi:hypothetical protein
MRSRSDLPPREIESYCLSLWSSTDNDQQVVVEVVELVVVVVEVVEVDVPFHHAKIRGGGPTAARVHWKHHNDAEHFVILETQCEERGREADKRRQYVNGTGNAFIERVTDPVLDGDKVLVLDIDKVFRVAW